MTIAGLESIRNTERWLEFAVCVQVDAEIFFPGKGQSPAAAKKVCGGCDVREQCLQWALDHDERGVWGALTEAERKALKRDTPRIPVRDIRICINGHNRAQVGVSPSGECRQCARDRELRYKTRVRQGLVQTLPHGSRSRYQLGCRCDLCVAANSAYTRGRRGRGLSLGPTTGAQR